MCLIKKLTSSFGGEYQTFWGIFPLQLPRINTACPPPTTSEESSCALHWLQTQYALRVLYAVMAWWAPPVSRPSSNRQLCRIPHLHSLLPPLSTATTKESTQQRHTWKNWATQTQIFLHALHKQTPTEYNTFILLTLLTSWFSSIPTYHDFAQQPVKLCPELLPA